MELYGGSPLSFAACWGLENAVRQMLLEEGCDPNRPEWACAWTGFLPLHAVVVTGNIRMYKALTDKDTLLTHAANRMQSTLQGSGTKWGEKMNALQLATKKGDRAMFELIMADRMRIVWKWGPAVQYEINLGGIDSAGDGGNDVLEIVCEPNALPATTALLLDDVFFGLLHKLIVKKWKGFGRSGAVYRGCRTAHARKSC
jgi:hypothetical protein